jgi:hypothetical protein
MLVEANYGTIHFFRLGLHGGCPFDIDWMLACSGAELISFAFRLKPVEELYRSPPMGIGSADTSRLPKKEELHGLFKFTSKYHCCGSESGSMCLGLPDPDPLVRGMDPDLSIIKRKQ